MARPIGDVAAHVDAIDGAFAIAEVDVLDGLTECIGENGGLAGNFVFEIESFDEEVFGFFGEDPHDVHDAPDLVIVCALGRRLFVFFGGDGIA